MTMIAAVPADYRHYSKQVVPQAALDVGGAILKLYHLERAGEPVPVDIAESAKALVERAAGQGAFDPGDCGFVLLHRCGADFYFLLITVWRGVNEAWQAVWYRQGAMSGFAPFDAAYPAPSPGQGLSAGPLRPTFCVWELGIVAHEALAWSRLLASSRDAAALSIWRADEHFGVV